jgi:hypothetical protein
VGEHWLGQDLNEADACVGMVSDFLLLQLFASKVVSFSSTETHKLAVSLFHETTKTSLFVLDSVKTNIGSSFGFSYIRRGF